MRQFYAGILTETDMMTYKLGGEYRLYVIRALSLSAVYIYKISENFPVSFGEISTASVAKENEGK